MSKDKKLKEIAGELEGASKMHAGQAKKIKSMLKKSGPFKMKTPLYEAGMWANIHAKRKRGESPAGPGDPDRPSKKEWDKNTK